MSLGTRTDDCTTWSCNGDEPGSPMFVEKIILYIFHFTSGVVGVLGTRGACTTSTSSMCLPENLA